jgi:peptidase inhibitor family I36
MALVAGTSAVAAQGAKAGGYGNKICDPGELCLYEHENRGGVFTEWYCANHCRLQDFRFDTFNDGSAVNDRITSVWNRTDKYATLFTEAGAQPGQCCWLTVQPAGRRGDSYDHVGREFNDSFSSVIIAYQ